MDFECPCPFCGEKRFKISEDEEPPFKALKCMNCSLVFVHPFPEINELAEHYDERYYQEWIDTQKSKRIRMWTKRLNRLERYRERGKLLDVGCGEGIFLKLAQQRGWQVSGIEISRFAAKYASSQLGVEIFCGDLAEAQYSESSFDVVTLWHVLEHVQDPKRYLLDIWKIIKSDGLLIIAVPNVNNLVMQFAYRTVKQRKLKLFKKSDKELHLYHFSDTTLKAYLNTNGFECVRLMPDFGIIENSKQLINLISVIPHYLFGINIFNAIEAWAIPKK